MDSEIIAAIAAAGPGQAPVLVTVLETRGSAPRHPGSKMLLRPGKELLGTVGGGRLEAAAIAAAGEAERRGGATLVEVEMLGEAALGQDMICGGSSLMLVEAVADAGAYRAADALLAAGRRALLVKRLAAERPASGADGAAACGVAHIVLDESLAAVWGSSEGLDTEAARRALASGKALLAEEGRLFYDPVIPGEKLVVFGGGHVGLALVRLAQGLDFSVTVVDDRAEMADPARFPPGVKTLHAGYAAAAERLPFDAATYAVILTRGHAHDLEAARAVLAREFRYAGMVGSTRKTRLIREQLAVEGVERGRLDSLHAPIGLPIGAETPEEIAVSILAEMIAVRRKAGSPRVPATESPPAGAGPAR